MNIFDKLPEKKFIKIFIDLYTLTDINHLLQILSSEIMKKSYRRIGLITKKISEFLTGIKPVMKLTVNGSLMVDFEKVEKKMLLEEVFDLPGKITEEVKKKMVIVFDEFQEIRNFGKGQIEKVMRAKFQHHKDVSYIFMGSKERIMEDMVLSPQSSFYKMGKIIYLDKIPEKEFEEFISKKFITTGFKVERDAIKEILEFTNNIPYYVQMFCYTLWNEKFWEKKITLSDIEEIGEKIVKQNENYFIELWESLTSYQRKVVVALANREEEKIYSHEFIEKFDLKSPSSLQKTIKELVKKRIIYKKKDIEFTDPFFFQWIKINFEY